MLYFHVIFFLHIFLPVFPKDSIMLLLIQLLLQQFLPSTLLNLPFWNLRETSTVRENNFGASKMHNDIWCSQTIYFFNIKIVEIYKTNIKNKVKKKRRTALAIARLKSDNYMGSNRKKILSILGSTVCLATYTIYILIIRKFNNCFWERVV